MSITELQETQAEIVRLLERANARQLTLILGIVQNIVGTEPHT